MLKPALPERPECAGTTATSSSAPARVDPAPVPGNAGNSYSSTQLLAICRHHRRPAPADFLGQRAGDMSSPGVRALEKLDAYVRESHSSIRILCAQFDTSGDGLLSHSELESALGSLLTANEIKGLIEFLDAGHDGTIDLQEVETAVRSFRRKKAAGELDGWTGAGEAPLDAAQIFPNWMIKRREFQLIFERFAGRRRARRTRSRPAGGGRRRRRRAARGGGRRRGGRLLRARAHRDGAAHRPREPHDAGPRAHRRVARARVPEAARRAARRRGPARSRARSRCSRSRPRRSRRARARSTARPS